ncbi:hypothetical protein NY2A_B883L [Paramecium bursaria Chlorella virus NY2A]|uniref:Uncharacterized protein B004R n=1 Tax=Paramecium bursaria Chlorella virus NY2A TaxID=46021 RepID=A7IVM9_PBCVN|nr:hypothetical protein NY2A_B004R [Paramecium bursaria Chlorella virus NY2A]YP_001498079.1 hypothetical protein NY2A_B883L [Paramecium bursaria Chlorella virus NY2A]ABT14403.1 hypothetical protein NY2A_B004R [Paramecium bursaria Chlorella virus NY2A]ABT15282.1 hypothetical protein NY2A_B883L [Paramecium bursaria Chlorella virus NY2A]
MRLHFLVIIKMSGSNDTVTFEFLKSFQCLVKRLVNDLNSFGGVDHKHGANAVQTHVLGEETLDRLEDRSVRRTRCNTLDRLDGIDHERLVVGEEILDGRHHW